MNRYPCPCCGYRVFGEPPGSYSICPICFWEDDALQLEFATTLDGGANRSTLLEAQRFFATHGACDHDGLAQVRPFTGSDERDPNWRPIDLARDAFERWGESNVTRAPRVDTSLYYWSAEYWRNSSHE